MSRNWGESWDHKQELWSQVIYCILLKFTTFTNISEPMPFWKQSIILATLSFLYSSSLLFPVPLPTQTPIPTLLSAQHFLPPLHLLLSLRRQSCKTLNGLSLLWIQYSVPFTGLCSDWIPFFLLYMLSVSFLPWICYLETWSSFFPSHTAQILIFFLG